MPQRPAPEALALAKRVAEVGAYARMGDDPSWDGMRHALQSATDADFVAGGCTVTEVGSVTDHRVQVGPRQIVIRTYVPDRPGPHPVLMYMHGGGGVVGSIDWLAHRAQAAEVAARTPCVVADVEFSLAPEHPFPTALEQCDAALAWLHDRAGRLDLDPSRIIVGGESNGGGLATALCLMARDRGGPPIAGQLLCSPGTDLAHIETYPSVAGYATAFDDPAVGPGLAALRSLYCSTPDDVFSPLCSPMLAEDHAGLPPAHIIVLEHDALRSENEAYAELLAQAGVPVTRSFLAGHVHGATALVPSWEGVGEWRDAMVHGTRSLLATSRNPQRATGLP